jgi:hypothetical protein
MFIRYYCIMCHVLQKDVKLPTSLEGLLADVWKYSLADGQWMWVDGPQYVNYENADVDTGIFIRHMHSSFLFLLLISTCHICSSSFTLVTFMCHVYSSY